ncbi:auxin-responsive protein IAA12-like [Hordeum vulgare subsp. vulgare]|nr:auxin-responsive protein IAA12-like [Hordeum vulgare subsp. vulgare]
MRWLYANLLAMPFASLRQSPPIKHGRQPCHCQANTSNHTSSSQRARAIRSRSHRIQTYVLLKFFSSAASSFARRLEMEATDNLLMATELRLGLPGTDDKPQRINYVSPPATPRGKKRTLDAFEATASDEDDKSDDVQTAPPVAKAQVVGWPPVRSYRKSCFQAAASKSKAKKADETSSNNAPSAAAPASTNGSFVKVSMDGAPYLRKIDMRMYKGYRELREALEAMFVCFSGADAGASNGGGANPSEYAITYEDKDGDLMLVGDVPFDMFSGTCKKLRIIKRSEATGLGSK